MRPSTQPNRKTTRRAFTLVEILVVVTIIALLAGMVSLRLFGLVGRSKQDVAKNEAAVIAKALSLYMLDTGRQAEDGMDLGVLILPPGDKEGGPNGPYLDTRDAIVDPWGNPYQARVPGQVHVDFDIMSFGRDGQPGGEGEDADVVH